LGIVARLPDLEAMKGAQNNVVRSGKISPRVCRARPIIKRLLAVMLQPGGLTRSLHLDQAHPWPQEIHEPTCLRLFKASTYLEAIGAIAAEQLIEKGLSFCTLRARVQAPAFSERDEISLDLLARHEDPPAARR
jgi:hypothetical protein